jgi:hypothetical protein
MEQKRFHSVVGKNEWMKKWQMKQHSTCVDKWLVPTVVYNNNDGMVGEAAVDGQRLVSGR